MARVLSRTKASRDTVLDANGALCWCVGQSRLARPSPTQRSPGAKSQLLAPSASMTVENGRPVGEAAASLTRV